MDPFAFLPNEAILNIALNESIDSIPSLCRSSQRFNDLICNSNYFWRFRFIQDFGQPEEHIINWKDAYENYGRVVGCGINGYSQLGSQNILPPSSGFRLPTVGIPMEKFPIELIKLKSKFIACGDGYTMLIDLDNNVWGIGSNDFGQLGLGDNVNRNIPIRLTHMRQPLKAKFIACGKSHTIIIDLNNNVLAFGINHYGQLGLGDTQDRNIPTMIQNLKAQSISCGQEHTILIDLDNNVLAFGNNHYGQLGLGDNVGNIFTPTKIPNIKAKFIASKMGHNMLIDLENDVWGFGYNDLGQLGLGDNNVRFIPTSILFQGNKIKAKFVACGNYHTIIIDLNNYILSCGDNVLGQLGIGNYQNRSILTGLTHMGQPFKAKSASCGFAHTMIIDLDDNVLAFGNNVYGQLGLGNTEKINIPTVIQNLKALSVSCGTQHTMMILKSNKFEDNVKLIPFNEAARKLNAGEFLRFDFLPKYQSIPHKQGNYIASFFDRSGDIYLVELQYNQTTNQINPPI
jgi:alpha-tubulin suppressor-like RCC1 family protein